MYFEQPLQLFLDELASAQSTPGGGSASALSGAIAASLASMVARLTLARADYSSAHVEIQAILQQTEQLRERFQRLMLEDIEAYGRLAAAFKMARATSEEKAERVKSIQARLVEAALVPLAMIESAAELVRWCGRIARIGNANVLSDVATGTILAQAAATGAAEMVRVNLKAMKDQERIKALRERLEHALAEVEEQARQARSAVEDRA